MQRTAGKLAMFLSGVYVLVLFSLVLSTIMGNRIPLLGWPIALVPAAAFVVSFLDAVKLHRTSRSADAARLWRRSLLYAVIGSILTVGAVAIIDGMNS